MCFGKTELRFVLKEMGDVSLGLLAPGSRCLG